MRLPPAVRVLAADEVGPDFHARFDAVSKTYHYRVWNAEVLSPFERPYVWHIAGPRLDVAAMQEAARRIEGRHDFASFESTGSARESTVRTIVSSRVSTGQVGLKPPATSDGALITYDICGDGFLRHMVRGVVGTLVEVGRGRRSPAWIDEVLAARSRHLAGRTAPAAGLFLAGVQYR
jgi:tRNA pseudouridine38-40 synthase